jgi:hypothetical protein
VTETIFHVAMHSRNRVYTHHHLSSNFDADVIKTREEGSGTKNASTNP